MPRFFSAIIVFIAIFSSGSANANDGGRVSSVCDSSAHMAAQEFEIPVDVMLALTRVETGRGGQHGLNPWPWTVNMEGDGYWFASRGDALRFALDHHQSGAISFDIGCFQINYKWHGEFFDSVEDMFEPRLNAYYAARFLTQLYLEFGSWSAAAGAFHSRTPSKAESYTARFDRVRLNLETESDDTMLVSVSPTGLFDRRGSLRVATITLSPLVSGGSPKLGSLFPDTRASVGDRQIVDTPNQGS